MKELIDALHVIQDECKKHDKDGGCKECPLQYEEGLCYISDWTPNAWRINDKVQRAFCEMG